MTHRAPAAPFVYHHTSIGKGMFLESAAKSGVNFFYFHLSFINWKSPMNAPHLWNCAKGVLLSLVILFF
jgi:hypothetical protein